MKKNSFYLTFFFIAFNLLSHAQGEFAHIGAKWHYSYATSSDTGFPNLRVGYIIQESVKDTIVMGQLCRKLESTQFDRPYNSNVTPDITQLQAIYIYSNTDTVFYYNEDLGRFLHLYIFSVSVGDTVKYHSPYATDTFFRMKITDLTYSTVNNIQLKTIHQQQLDGIGFGASSNVGYTEKIGTIHSPLLAHGMTATSSAFIPNVRCYKDDEINFVNTVDIPCDFIDGPNSVDDYSIDDNKLMVYPNPSSGLLHLKIQGLKLSDIQVLAVYDILGKSVKQITFNKSESVVDVSNLSKGIYLLKVNIKGLILNRKFIVN